MIDRLFTKGYCIFDGDHLAELLSTDDLIFEDPDVRKNDYPVNKSDLVQEILKRIHVYVGLEFIEPYCDEYNLLETDIRGNLSKSSRFSKWHTDSDEPSDVFCLLYHNSMRHCNEGAILFKHGDTLSRFLPKYGSLIVVNNMDPAFKHKAEYTEHRRIVSCYSFNTKWKDGFRRISV